jgi:hypothetical protein
MLLRKINNIRKVKKLLQNNMNNILKDKAHRLTVRIAQIGGTGKKYESF